MTMLRKQGAVKFFEAKLDFTLGPAELDHRIQDDKPITVIDVRTPEAFRKGHVPGAINLPEERWPSREGLRGTGVNVIYCYTQQCQLAARACLHFAREGYSVMELEGGWKAWQEYGLTVETGDRLEKAA